MSYLVGNVKELDNQATLVRAEIDKVFAERGESIEYMVGTMIELPVLL